MWTWTGQTWKFKIISKIKSRQIPTVVEVQACLISRAFPTRWPPSSNPSHFLGFIYENRPKLPQVRKGKPDWIRIQLHPFFGAWLVVSFSSWIYDLLFLLPISEKLSLEWFEPHRFSDHPSSQFWGIKLGEKENKHNLSTTFRSNPIWEPEGSAGFSFPIYGFMVYITI